MKELVKRALRPAVSRSRQFIRDATDRPAIPTESHAQQAQRAIVNQYLAFKAQGIAPYPKIYDAGFRVHSQFEEDGITLYVLAMIGFKTRRVVEMCCGTGDESMSANLILNHGFDGFLFDGDEQNVNGARSYFASKRDCLLYRPVIEQAWITVEAVNDILTKSGCIGEVDMLSLDLDGNQYWIWDAIKVISPRLLIVETHNCVPPDRSITVPYKPDFRYEDQAEPDFRSVSLLAMARLCKRRGYRLIGAHRHGFNAYFLRNDEGIDFFQEVTVEQVLDNHWSRWGIENRWPKVKDMPWHEVE
jgi:hypothetical protein